MCKSTIFNIFNRHISMKKKYIRADEAPFISKELHNTIMRRLRLRIVFLKHRTNTNKKKTAPKKIYVKNS